MARPGDSPKRIYAELILKLALGRSVSEAEVESTPDPDLFRDAVFLVNRGTWTPQALDECDALLLALVRKIAGVKVTRGQ